ncbi:MAG: hypothetical protein ACSLFK_06920 [Gemmatimonadaceae bacterium]
MPLLRSIVVTGLLLALTACRNPFSPGDRVTLWVEDIVAPASVSPDAPFTVTLTVRTGGCLSFRGFEAERSAGRLELTALGRDGGGAGKMCTADIRYEQHNVQVMPPFDAQLTIAARQPDATEIAREIQFD